MAFIASSKAGLIPAGPALSYGYSAHAPALSLPPSYPAYSAYPSYPALAPTYLKSAPIAAPYGPTLIKAAAPVAPSVDYVVSIRIGHFNGYDLMCFHSLIKRTKQSALDPG